MSDQRHRHLRPALLPAHQRRQRQAPDPGQLRVRVRQARREVRRRHQRLLALARTCSSGGRRAPTSSPRSRTSRPAAVRVHPGLRLERRALRGGRAGRRSAATRRAISLYVQDKWQVTPNLTLTYGLRWDGTNNPPAQSHDPGPARVLGGGARHPASARRPRSRPATGSSWARASAPPTLRHRVQARRRARGLGLLLRADPDHLLHHAGQRARTAVQFCFFNPTCFPPGGFPNLFPDSLQRDPPARRRPGINYIDPELRNPRVMNTTASCELNLSPELQLSTTYVYAHSDFLSTGGFSSTQWNRNFVMDRRGPVRARHPGPAPWTTPSTIGPANGQLQPGQLPPAGVQPDEALRGQLPVLRQLRVVAEPDNASSERDTDTFFGPQDPFNVELDYGHNGLDVPHQFKSAGEAELGAGFRSAAVHRAHRRALPGLHPRGHQRRRRHQPGLQQRPPGGERRRSCSSAIRRGSRASSS